jgi:hypothetical protein
LILTARKGNKIHPSPPLRRDDPQMSLEQYVDMLYLSVYYIFVIGAALYVAYVIYSSLKETK